MSCFQEILPVMGTGNTMVTMTINHKVKLPESRGIQIANICVSKSYIKAI